MTTMTQAIQIPKESSKTTIPSLPAFEQSQESHVESAESSATIYHVQFEPVHKPLPGSISVDGLLAHLAEHYPDFDEGMKEARQFVGKVFYEDEASLRKMRMDRGMSQTDLANIISTSQPQIAKIESGRFKPGLDTIMRLARAFEVAPGEVTEVLVAGLQDA